MSWGLSCFQRWDPRSPRSAGADKQPQDWFIIHARRAQYIGIMFRKVKHLLCVISEEVPAGGKKTSLLAADEESVNPRLREPSHPKHSTLKHAAGMNSCPTDPVFFLQTGWIRTKPSYFLREKIIHIKQGRILASLSTLYDTPSSPDLFTEALQRAFLQGGWRYPPCKSPKLHCPTKSWNKLTLLSKGVAKLLFSLHC